MRILLILLCLSTAACAPNTAILEDNRAKFATPAMSPTPAEPGTKITLAQLMERVATAPPDAYLFPCTLLAHSDDDRAKLRTLRQLWISKEQDSRYLISPSSGCICPGVCVLAIEDAQVPAPNNFSLLAIEDLSTKSYSWLAKNLDFSNAELGWTNTTPQITFNDPAGTRKKICSVERDDAQRRLVTRCTDSEGKTLPPIRSQD